MIIRFAIAILTTAFLGAAAYAVVPAKSESAALLPLNITTIEKNQVWPLKGFITLNPCAKVYCKSV